MKQRIKRYTFRDNPHHSGQAGIPKVPIKCIETNKTYESINEAARDVGIRDSTISKAVKEGKSIHGLTFIKTN